MKTPPEKQSHASPVCTPALRPEEEESEWTAALETAAESVDKSQPSPLTYSMPNAAVTDTVPETAEDIAIKKVLHTLGELNRSSREAAVMTLAKRIKVKIVGENHTMKELITASIAAKAVPGIHAVIRDEVIRLGVGRREYRAVVKPLFFRIAKSIGWKDVPGVSFCPPWSKVKDMVHSEYAKGPNKAVHTKVPDWPACAEGCVWTDVSLYLAERLITYRSELPDTYRVHLKTIATRVAMVEELCPDMGAAIRIPIKLQNGTRLLLVVMADGALLYRRAKIKVAMSQTEVVATVLNEGVQSAHAQIPLLAFANGDSLKSHLENAGYELLQRYTTNEFVVRMPSEYPGASTRIAEVGGAGAGAGCCE